MKKTYLILFFFLSISIFAQQKNSNLLELKSEMPDFIEANEIEQVSFYQVEKKSKGLAIIYSLLLPGMGEMYADAYSSGQYFTVADGALWGFLIGFNAYGNWQEKNYKAFAESNAGVELDGKDEDYLATISNYVNIDQYNREQELNREFKAVYERDEYYWNWQNPEKRGAYRDLWESSERSFNNVQFAIGGLILNRIASAINAVRLVNKRNKKNDGDLGWSLNVGMKRPINLPPNISFGFTTSF